MPYGNDTVSSPTTPRTTDSTQHLLVHRGKAITEPLAKATRPGDDVMLGVARDIRLERFGESKDTTTIGTGTIEAFAPNCLFLYLVAG
jgi:hypothetical protein